MLLEAMLAAGPRDGHCLLWASHLPAVGQAGSMTYSVAGGQYVANCATSWDTIHEHRQTTVGAAVIAYALD